MRKTKFTMIRLITMLVVLIFISACERNIKEKKLNNETDLSTFEKEIELRLREYENYLQNGDSIALGNMYMVDAEIIPSTIGRENIIKVFSSIIQDSIVGNFETTKLWGDNELLVEEGKGIWLNKNGQVGSSGKYLLVWKKDEGKWKILRDTWFPDKKK